ncbi:unnamed protein product [Rotaria sordida]|uniref:Uncharacterized protein n=1 Tax=Rotaria sordida TaxID=392033 RepID=A0A814WWD8_9BILA|nr:unnamed protein product [Rotaria sordida]CAF1211196.1 unnamed protein product [Rotaria sordida]
MSMQGIILSVVILLFAYGIHYCWLLLPIINGYGAKYMCSSIFIVGYSERQQRTEDLDMFPMKYVTFTVNTNDLSVSASLFRFAQRKAIYRNGLGAILISELTEDQIHAQTFNKPISPDINQDNIPWSMDNKLDDDDCFPSNINQTLLQGAINNLFIERDPTKLIRTRAIVISYDVKLIAE